MIPESGTFPGEGNGNPLQYSCLENPMDVGAWCRLLCPWDSPGKSTGVECHFLLQGIFPTQGLNPGLPHCRQTLYRLSHQGSPHQILPGWDTQLLGQEPAVSPFDWQSNRALLCYFTRYSLSEVHFGTSAQRPSFWHQQKLSWKRAQAWQWRQKHLSQS